MFSPDRVLVKPLKFVLAGGINTVVFYLVYAFLVHIGWHYTLALVVDYTGGIVAGYCMNRYWTFSSHVNHERSFYRYCVTYGMVFCLNLLLLSLMVELGVSGPILGQILVIGTITIISFLLQNFWVFRGASDGMVHGERELSRGLGQTEKISVLRKEGCEP